MTVAIAVNGTVIKTINAKNIFEQPDDKESTYKVYETGSLICHKRKDGIDLLAIKLIHDRIAFDRSKGKIS